MSRCSIPGCERPGLVRRLIALGGRPGDRLCELHAPDELRVIVRDSEDPELRGTAMRLLENLAVQRAFAELRAATEGEP